MLYLARVRRGVPQGAPLAVRDRQDLVNIGREWAEKRAREDPQLFGLVGPENVDPDGDLIPAKVEEVVSRESIDIANGLWASALAGTLPVYHRSVCAGEVMLWEA